MITARSPSNRCDPVFSAFFGEGTADGKSERLAAATLWRHLSHNTEPPPLTALDSDMRGWTGAVGYGRHRVRYDARRRIVGILGREYEVPGNGDTLLLLLEDRPDEEMPEVVAISMPSVVAENVRVRGGPMTKDEKMNAIVESNRGAVAAWLEAIHAQPEVVAFLRRGERSEKPIDAEENDGSPQ